MTKGVKKKKWLCKELRVREQLTDFMGMGVGEGMPVDGGLPAVAFRCRVKRVCARDCDERTNEIEKERLATAFVN